MIFALLASLFLSEPMPLNLPRAEAYLVSEGERSWLEDRYNRLDLWTSRAVDGRWIDEEGRQFILATLDVKKPLPLAEESTVTRTDFVRAAETIDPKRDLADVRDAIAAISTVPIAEKPVRPHQRPRGYVDVEYWQGTNETAIVCAFRFKKSDAWRLAIWELVDGDEFDAARETFEEDFLEKECRELSIAPATALTPKPAKRGPAIPERDYLRADAHHSVTNYAGWHFSDAEAITVLDDLPARDRAFVAALTNELPALRARFAATLPTPIDGSNVLFVARLFASRDEFLDALEAEGLTNMTWSAAYWCARRRELVAYLPEAGTKELLRTIRHETLHQYLSYAASMIPTSPWLNEGYAQYFEDEGDLGWGDETVLTPEFLKTLSQSLPALFTLDYEGFYAGSDAERRLKYRLARSIAIFLEKGASKVRFDPFRNLKRDYFKALFETKDMRAATAAAFGTPEKLKLFVAEWLKFWKER